MPWIAPLVSCAVWEMPSPVGWSAPVTCWTTGPVSIVLVGTDVVGSSAGSWTVTDGAEPPPRVDGALGADPPPGTEAGTFAAGAFTPEPADPAPPRPPAGWVMPEDRCVAEPPSERAERDDARERVWLRVRLEAADVRDGVTRAGVAADLGEALTPAFAG